ncbi:MAG: hypothetical protein DHS20C14_07010 [Phycisphaeraceae bacterium]|nr:MAG: hypothetical protein DHS20C14_07010 [Phycisphaeraceae bacterium]
MNQHSTTPTTTTPAARTARPARRGSALLIVIGVLALVAVLGAIYISIGQSDTQSARAVVKREQLQSLQFEVGSHLASIIATDRLDTYVVPSSRTGTAVDFQRTARETWDYPYTDWSVRSVLDGGVQDWQLFNPPGRHTIIYPITGVLPADDPRVAYDAWLASTEPEYLGPEVPFGTPPTANGRVFSSNRPEGRWLDRRDWWQISNLAPDGRFVSLYNLRPEPNPITGVVGGFDAFPGIGTYTDPETSAPRAAMTYGLTLLRTRTLDGTDTTIQAFDPQSLGVWVPGADDPQPLPGAGDLLNVPAVWTMYQRYSFFPLNQPFIMYDRGGQIADWSSPDYAPYQWGDADGDGMADSRWFELVNASDPNNIIQIDNDPEYRVFVAARVMDLSALVNVNVAGDLLTPPTVDYPYGLSLSEIDLRRLLTMSDQGLDWSGRWDSTGTTFVNGARIGSGLTLADLDHPNEDVSGLGGDPVQVYRPYVQGLLDADSDPISGYFTKYPDYTVASPNLLSDAAKSYSSEVVGAYAYDALRLAIERETPLDPRFAGLIDTSVLGTFPNATPAPEFRLIQGSHFWFEYDPINEPDRLNVPTGAANDSRLDDENEQAKRRYDYDQLIGRIDISRPGERVASPADFGAGLFGINDLGELMTFRGVNDPAVTTRLEQTMLGRTADGSLFTRATTRRLSPLLVNRSLDLDRFGHGDGRVRGGSAVRPFPYVMGQIDPESMVLFGLSPRQRITTFNGSAPVKPALGVAPGTALTSADAPRKLAGLMTDAGGLFGVFRSALVPFPLLGNDALNSTWYDDVADLIPGAGAPRASRTLNYGHGSAELAMTLAAHMAANTADSADGNSAPTVATLALDGDLRDDIINAANDPVDEQIFPWWHAGASFDAGAANLPGASNGSSLMDERRQARNIFGLEPQPFLIEAASLVVYSDTPSGAGGDTDSTTLERPQLLNRRDLGLPGGISPGSVSNITINTDRVWKHGMGGPAGPNDMMIQLIAFKLTNPFDHSVSLGAPTWNEIDQRWEDWDYYIEHAGRFYLLAEFVEFSEALSPASNNDSITNWAEVVPLESQLQPVSLSAGQTRVFYVLANNEVGHNQTAQMLQYDYREVDERWENIMGVAGTYADTDQNETTGAAAEWVNEQFKITNASRPVRIKEFDPESGVLRRTADTDTNGQKWRDLFTIVPDLGATEPKRRNPDRAKTDVVRLWRSLRAETQGETDDTSVTNSIGQYNLVENDLLADRLAAPDGNPDVLDPIAPVAARGNAEVDGTISFTTDANVKNNPNPSCDDPAYDPTTMRLKRNDNTGWTLALWGTIRRPDGADQPGPGQLPEWMLEVRDPMVSGTDGAVTIARNVAKRWDQDTGPNASRGGLSEFSSANGGFEAADFAFDCNGADFASGFNTKDYDIAVLVKGDTLDTHIEIQRRLGDLQKLSGRNERVVYSMSLEPGIPGGNQSADPFRDEVAAKFDLTKKLGNNVAGKPIHYTLTGAVQPELFIADGYSNTDGNSTARPGDLLLALGVGAVQAPNPDRQGNLGLDYDIDEEWLTLSEMLAIALGYDVPVEHNPGGPADEAAFRIDDPYFGIVNQWSDVDGDGNVFPTVDNDDWRYVLPNGRLSIDDYLSFFDTDNDGVFDEPTGLNAGNTVDVRTGSGIPMALDVIARVRMHEPLPPIGGATGSAHLLSRVVPGTININTAPASTLRLLAGLSPSLDSFTEPTTSALQRPAWWAANATGSGIQNSGYPDLSASPPSVFAGQTLNDATNRPDVAGSIVAYRDRLVPIWRRASDPETFDTANTFPIAGSTEFRFDPFVSAQADLPRAASRNYTQDTGREVTTGIRGLRETPGFQSTAELLAVAFRRENDPTTGGGANENFNAFRHLTMQALGTDTAPTEIVSVGGAEASMETDTYNNGTEADLIIDDLGERLALANNVLGAVSVSSDVYAVWYLVHGYREGDVSELRPGDPLVPSYARRFLMILDRSNVMEEGDAPRVVYFREVPM